MGWYSYFGKHLCLENKQEITYEQFKTLINDFTQYDMKIIVCKCKQCKYVKNMRHKNRKKVKRMLNKKRRLNKDAYFVHYWA